MCMLMVAACCIRYRLTRSPRLYIYDSSKYQHCVYFTYFDAVRWGPPRDFDDFWRFWRLESSMENVESNGNEGPMKQVLFHIRFWRYKSIELPHYKLLLVSSRIGSRTIGSGDGFWPASLQCLQRRTQIAKFMGPTWSPSGANRTQVGPMMAPWTLLSGDLFSLWTSRTKTSMTFE